MAGIETLLLVGVVVALVVLTTTTVRVYRAYRRLRHRATRVLDLARRGEVVAADPLWWLNQRDRRRLWRSVAAAERAVGAAASAGVPTGDLRFVARQLRSTAASLDAGLRTGHRSSALQRQVGDLVAAADDVARAATDAVAADAAPQTARVIDAARLELAALREVWRGRAVPQVRGF